MSISRRRFLKLGLNGAFIITTGNVLVPLGKNFFKDGSPGSLRYRFAIASDGHYGQPGTHYEAQHDRMIHWINAEKTNQRLDFTVINGNIDLRKVAIYNGEALYAVDSLLFASIDQENESKISIRSDIVSGDFDGTIHLVSIPDALSRHFNEYS